MALEDKFRTSTEYREILRILQRSSSQAENFLWQSHGAGKNVIPVELIEIDFVAREVVVSLDTKRFRILPDHALYVKLDYRSAVFKCENFKLGSHSVSFPLPAMVKTLELRQHSRSSFGPNDDKFVSLRSSLKAAINLEAGNDLNVRVFDVSRQGLGLVVSEQNRTFFKNNRILWIIALQGLALEYPILAEVLYINTELDPRFQNRRQKDLKVGLKLSGLIPEESFNIFLK